MKCARYSKLIALCLSDGGVGVSSGTKYIHFTNKSSVLLELFKNEVRKFSKNKVHLQQKERGTTLRVFDIKLANYLLKITNSYRTRPCNGHPKCKQNKVIPCKRCKIFSTGKRKWTTIQIPNKLFKKRAIAKDFLQIYASCDGYPSIFPRTKSWSRVERIVAIVCHHPLLKQQLSRMLNYVGVEHTIKKCSLEMRSRSSIQQFAKNIGFVSGVEMTGNSKYWKGTEKNEVLRKILKSYEVKLPEKGIINFLRKL